ncbi:DUF4190 domain-containing protein [Streptantibioticus rubrisoli]|uniref:DUF4190 domain-containing protein n=1 Tax=Streptantibioticus rubrisoli TaxID=1387313 RepID=A0ABT1PAA8_9ACTN|nr:DUF4190 domain-containing protein [Streptantibioticus rubrisoli]MCQ4041716.1 DUF4190 domain-containing protein [Streptantibioticus rubrisoli]
MGTETPVRDRPASLRYANSMAAASFIFGLVGILVFNVLFGPAAIVLGGLALLRGTTRRARARLGICLGAADLVMLAVLTSLDHTVSW